MKNSENLEGAKFLSKKQQQAVRGGSPPQCREHSDCPPGMFCDFFKCYRD